MSINVSVNDPDWDAKVMSEFFIQMMHKQLGEGNERKCINAVRNIMDSLASTESQGGMIGSITHLVLAVKQLLDETQQLRNARVAPSNSPALPQSQ